MRPALKATPTLLALRSALAPPGGSGLGGAAPEPENASACHAGAQNGGCHE